MSEGKWSDRKVHSLVLGCGQRESNTCNLRILLTGTVFQSDPYHSPSSPSTSSAEGGSVPDDMRWTVEDGSDVVRRETKDE